MEESIKYKLLQYLNQKKSNAGFTLIELLVVIIIIGILSAVALPNLLGQIGKARETEIKNAVGTINRAQQAFHFENQTFGTLDEIGISIGTSDYINGFVTGTGQNVASVAPNNTDATADGTRAYAGAIAFDTANGNYGTIVCRTTAPSSQLSVSSSISFTGSEEAGDSCPIASSSGPVVVD